MNRSKGSLYVISAPSGGGKTSLISALVDNISDILVSVSYTTRPKRSGEIEGVHYNFVDQAAFDDMLTQGLFLEHALVFGYSYGTSRTWVQERLDQGFDVLLEIDWQGAEQVRKLFKNNNISLFILPPSLPVLAERLRARKQDTQEVIAKRLSQAQEDMAQFVHYDYVIVNEDFDIALREMKAIVTAERLRMSKQQVRHEETIQGLLAR